MTGRTLASSQLDGCYGNFRISASTWTRLPLSKALFREENCRSAVVPTCLVFKNAFNEADDTIFCFTCRKMFKEKKNKTSTKADYQIFCGLHLLKYMVMKYMVFGFS